MQFINDDGTLVMYDKSEGLKRGHKPYSRCFEKLLGIPSKQEFEGIVSAATIFNKDVVSALISDIENLHKLKWYDAILNSMEFFEYSAFSEYETYAQYVLSKKPELYKLKKKDFISSSKYIDNISDLEGSADFASFSNYGSVYRRERFLKNMFRIGFWKKLLSGEINF